MAGIGFELRKVIGRGSMGSFIKAAVSGTMLVAGPWLISIVSITLMQQFMGVLLGEIPKIFMGVVVYCYAFSLVLSGGFHFIFTRVIADLLYTKKENESTGFMLVFLIPTTLLSAGLAAAFVPGITLTIEHLELFKISTIVLFTSINLIWVLMIFSSLLRWYMRVLVIYVLGMVCAIVGVYYFGLRYSVAGILLGFAIGHVIIALMLLVLSVSEYPPEKYFAHALSFFTYLKKYFYLFLTGMFYNFAIWIDKMVFWFHTGEQIPGSFIRLFEQYDIAVYLANLTMIPGLVYFTIVTETGFYIALRKFLISLGSARFADIQKRKYSMIEELNTGIKDQSFFQGAITIFLVILAPFIARFMLPAESSSTILQFTLGGVFFHLLFLTLINFLFYIELYHYSFLTTFVFFILNGTGSFFMARSGYLFIPGLSYMLSALISAFMAMVLLIGSIRQIDRLILVRSST
jgi:polysaccharide biosynthesis protein PelG